MSDEANAAIIGCDHELWRSLLGNLFELVSELSEDLRFTYVSPGFERALGYSPSELLGRDCIEFVHPEDVKDLLKAARRGMPSGRPFRSKTRFRDREGKWHLFDWTAQAVTREQEKTRTLVCGLDVTDRTEADERLRNLIAAVPDALVLVRADGTIALFNPKAEELFGYSADEVLDRSLEILVPDHYRRSHAEYRLTFFHNRRNRGMGFGSDLRALRKDGTEFPVEINLGRVGGEWAPFVVASIRDVSARARAEQQQRRYAEQVQHSHKLESLGTLASGIAHDINNMLAAIMNYSNLAMSRVQEDGLALKAIEENKKVVARMAGLCNQLMEYAGKGRATFSAVDLSREAEAIGTLLDSSISKKAELRLDLAPELPLVRADSSQLHQLLLNLVVNASESLGNAGGTIDIRTSMVDLNEAIRSDLYLADSLADGAYVCIEVSDTGSGLDAETKAKLFDPFFSTKSEGRGLGMAVVLGIVRRHEAAISVRPRPGGGTSVAVLFAPTTEAEAISDSIATLPSVTGTRREATILFVDDDGPVRNSAEILLRDAGYKILVARDGLEAVKIFSERSAEIDLVLLDLTLPGLGGEEVNRELHRIRRGVRIVLMSGLAEHAALERVGEPRPTGFVHKPYEVAALLESIDAITAATASASREVRPATAPRASERHS